MIKVGVLAVQGAVAEHLELLNQIPDVRAQEVKYLDELNEIDGLIIPGGWYGETKLELIELINNLNAKGKLISGICGAGTIFLEKSRFSSLLSNKLNQSHISIAKSIKAIPLAVMMFPSLTTLSETKFSLGKGSFSPNTSICFLVHSIAGVVYFTLLRIPAFAKNIVPAPHMPLINFPFEFKLLISSINSSFVSPYHPPGIIKASTSSYNTSLINLDGLNKKPEQPLIILSSYATVIISL